MSVWSYSLGLKGYEWVSKESCGYRTEKPTGRWMNEWMNEWTPDFRNTESEELTLPGC